MEKSYAGSISNKGSQKVKALFSSGPRKSAVVKTGADLRTGASKNVGGTATRKEGK